MGANDIVLGIRLTGDGSGLVGAAKSGADGLDDVTSAADKAAAAITKASGPQAALAAAMKQNADAGAKMAAGVQSATDAVTKSTSEGAKFLQSLRDQSATFG